MPFNNDKFNTILMFILKHFVKIYFMAWYQESTSVHIKVANIADTRKTTQQGQIQATTG